MKKEGGGLVSYWSLRVLPMARAAGLSHVHAFGVLWPVALGGLVRLADRQRLAVSCDSKRPALDCRGGDPKKAGALAPTWEENVALWRKRLAGLRNTGHYREPCEGELMPSATKKKPSRPKPAAKAAAKPAGAPAFDASLAIRGDVPLKLIRPCAFNVRRSFDDADVRGLAESISSIGLKEALLVRPFDADGVQVPLTAGDGWQQRVAYYELADGERRFRALSLIAEERDPGPVPVTVRNLTDGEVRAVMLASREQSRELSVSELVAGYAGLRAGLADDAALAAMVGRPVAHVRNVLRLGKLPGWALAAVDAGVLPRATAELVARVPGEEGRRRATACVLFGKYRPQDLDAPWDGCPGWEQAAERWPEYAGEPLSYRDTKDLIRNHFQVELKGAPFSRKELYVLPGEPERTLPDCEGCPSRAANNEEAKAEGTRGDVCLDVGCYRLKVEAHDERERAKFRKKCKLPDGADVNPDGAALDRDEKPAKGWLDWNGPVQQSELNADGFFAGKKFDGVKVSEAVLECPIVHGCALRLVLDSKHRPRHLVKTAEARKTLQEAGVLKKPERAKPAVRKSGLPEWEQDPGAKPEKAGPGEWEVDERAARIAAKVLREYTEDQCSALDGHEDAHEEGPIHTALQLAARAICYELIGSGGSGAADKLLETRFGATYKNRDETLDKAICELKPSQMIGLLVEIAAACELHFGNPEHPTGEALLTFAELDWPQLQDQARRELAGGETAEAKLGKAEAAEEGAQQK